MTLHTYIDYFLANSLAYSLLHSLLSMISRMYTHSHQRRPRPPRYSLAINSNHSTAISYVDMLAHKAPPGQLFPSAQPSSRTLVPSKTQYHTCPTYLFEIPFTNLPTSPPFHKTPLSQTLFSTDFLPLFQDFNIYTTYTFHIKSQYNPLLHLL